MNDMEKITAAFDLLEDADVQHEFDNFVVVHFDREQWDTYWAAVNNQGEPE